MGTDKQTNFQQPHFLGFALAFHNFTLAALFIIAGGVFLGHNLGYISDYIFHIVISWQMLLIAIGVISLIKRNVTAGVIMILTGGFFLVKRLDMVESAWFTTYWPIFLILLGIVLLFMKHRCHHPWHHHNFHHRCEKGVQTENIEDGYVKIDNSWGNSRHIVLDPVFKGGDIGISFGSVVLDLRRTTLEAPETYLHVNCSFGGFKLLIPSDWNLVIKANNAVSEFSDKRYLSKEIDTEHKLILRGDISFSSIEIRD
ncbi:membrane protein [Bacteroidia bacterium]|nr:membrane protein [Bacteroidia bacterium]